MKDKVAKLAGKITHLAARALKQRTKFNILDQYVGACPKDQHALDIFKGEWICSMPPDRPDLKAGKIPVYACPKFKWGITEISGMGGGVNNKTILELGPLEGEHSYLLERMGAASILAIEANQRAFLKCLIVKEVLQLKKVRFMLGDFCRYLENSKEHFDICIASGVLYHLTDPVKAIKLIARHTDKVYFWTLYYDAERIRRIPHLYDTFKGSESCSLDGFAYTIHKHYYGELLRQKIFLGGPREYSCWLPRQTILDALAHFGFKTIKSNFDEPAFAAGPAISIVALK